MYNVVKYIVDWWYVIVSIDVVAGPLTSAILVMKLRGGLFVVMLKPNS
jgi:hypothetical protein